MTFYFHTSYQGSPVGFQLSRWSGGMEQPEKISFQDIPSEDLHSQISNGGKAFAIGSNGGLRYLIVSDISFRDEADRVWYSACIICAAQEEEALFTKTVQKLLLDYTGFRKAYSGWFTAAPDQALSYAVDPAAIQAWLAAPGQDRLPDLQHPVADQFRAMIRDMDSGIDRRLYLLVLESTLSYFFNQNPVFNKEIPKYLFSEQEFTALLAGEPLPEPEKAAADEENLPIWEQLGISKAMFIQYVLVGAIFCIGFIGTIAHQIHSHIATRRKS